MSGYELRDIRDNEQQQHQQQHNQNFENRETNNEVQPDVVVIDHSSSTAIDQNSGQPNDRYKLVFIILLIHGIGTLMPWNMFMNAQSYFTDYKLAPVANISDSSDNVASDYNDELAELRKNFLSYLGLAAQVPNVVFNGLNLIVNMGSGNLKLRVNLTLFVEVIIFLITIILAVIDSSKWPVAFFYVTMISVVILNMASGIYQNCIFGTGAKFPGAYTNAILIGSNFSGVFTSTAYLLSIWLAPKPQEAAIYYFITALFVLLICTVSYNLLPYNLFFKFFDRASEQINILEIEESYPERELTSDRRDDVPESLKNVVDAMVPRPQLSNANSSFKGELKRKWQVLLKCWPQCLNVFLTFYVTLALFPAVLASTKQKQHEYISERYFVPFSCFFIFNVFAMIGNLIPSWTTWPGKDRIWIVVTIRLLFIPFFLFCNFNPETRHWPVLINNDVIFIIGNVLLALSSGYLSSLCMMFASSNLAPEEASSAGMLAAFFLVFGIFCGVNSSFFLTWIVELG